MPRYFVFFALLIGQVCPAFGQPEESWSAVFDGSAKVWRTLQGSPIAEAYEGDRLVLSPDAQKEVMGKFPDLLMDYTKDFNFSLELATAAPLEVFWNSSLTGENGVRLQLSPEEFLLTERYEGKEKRLSKYKPKSPFDLSEKFLLTIIQKGGETQVSLLQQGRLESMKPAKISYRTKQYSIGLATTALPPDHEVSYQIVLSELAISYVPFHLSAIREMPEFGKKEKLPALINSDSLSEFAPYINPSGEVLYFLREVAGENQVMVSTLEEEEWMPPGLAPLPADVGGSSVGSIISISEDDHIFFFQASAKQSPGLATARKRGEALSAMETIAIPDQMTQDPTATYFIASSGNLILASMDGKGSVGGKDLYVAIRSESGEFSKPIHLGTTVNSEGDEVTPFLAADTKTLYFSSSGLPGYGVTDLYMSRRLDDSWTLWSPPTNLGKTVNTMGEEKYFTVDTKGAYGYFTAYDHHTGLGDLYQVKLPLGIKPLPVMLVSGIVRDIKTNEPVQAAVTYRSLDNEQNFRQILTDESGYYRMVLPENKDYGIYAEAEGYYPKSDSISLVRLSGYRAITRDLYLTPIEVEERIALNNIFFKQSRPDILQQSIPELNNLYKLLLNTPSMKIRIEGHTDGIGNRQMNITLSMARANAIKDFLTGKGIASNRIRAVGYGPDRPVADNEHPETRKLNRRVEFFVTEK